MSAIGERLKLTIGVILIDIYCLVFPCKITPYVILYSVITARNGEYGHTEYYNTARICSCVDGWMDLTRWEPSNASGTLTLCVGPIRDHHTTMKHCSQRDRGACIITGRKRVDCFLLEVTHLFPFSLSNTAACRRGVPGAS